MISLEHIMEEVSSLGPNWTWLIRSCDPFEGKPGKFLVNICFEKGYHGAQYFPVFGDDIESAFNESLRRARAFLSEGVR